MIALAKKAGMNPNDALDDWDHDAAILEYLGERDRATANELAYQQLEKRLLPQGEMFDEDAA